MNTQNEGTAPQGGAEENEPTTPPTTHPEHQGEDLNTPETEAVTAPADGESQATSESEESPTNPVTAPLSPPSLLFHAPDLDEIKAAASKKNPEDSEDEEPSDDDDAVEDGEVVSRKRRRRRRGGEDIELTGGSDEDPPNTVTKVRTPRVTESASSNKVASVKGSTRLEAKRQRRRDSRASGRRRHVITEAEFLARRESVDRQMIVRQKDDRIQIGVLEDGVLAEHFVSKTQQDSLIGNVYLGKVQNVLPSMEAAFVDIGRGRNAVLYAGEVNWDASGLDGQPRKIENALKSGDSVLVQVTKDPIGHKGARLTSQVSLPGRFLVYVPGGSMTGISRKLPDTERARLKKILKDKLPDGAGVIVRTAAEGAAEEELAHDINRLRAQWEDIESKSKGKKTLAPEMLYQEPDLTIKTVRDVFNEDFSAMVVQGDQAWDNIEAYVTYVAPDLIDRLKKWDGEEDLFDHYRIEEGLAKALDRKVFLPSGGSLVIDRTEAMTVIDVNTGKFTGSGGNLEETVTKNNLEAAEEIVRQLRLRDIGGIIVIDFIDMVLESNRDLVLRRLIECLGRDRTKHQVAEVTSLGLVQMTRKRMGTGLLEVFSETCEHCAGRGLIVHDQPLKGRSGGASGADNHGRGDRKRNKDRNKQRRQDEQAKQDEAKAEATRHALANIAAASSHPEDSEGQGKEDDARRSPESGESKSAKKRKRRKRNKGRGGAESESNQRPTGDDTGAEPTQGDHAHGVAQGEPDAVVTIQGEVVTLPQGSRNQEASNGESEEQVEESQGEQGPFSLDSLAAAFERKPGGERPDEQETADTDRTAPEDSSVDEASDERPARQARRSRREPLRNRSGREGAEAARRAALEALQDMRPGRGGRKKPAQANQASNKTENGTSDAATSRTQAAETSSGGSSPSRKPRRQTSRRATTGPVAEPHTDKPVTGVATPGQGASGETAEPSKSEAPKEPAKSAPKKRRSRRAASSTGVGGSIHTEETGSAQGGSVSTASYSAPASEAAPAEDVPMLGVGVKASEIKRTE
ncbi:MAG: Rne/Rng family ribonuclease [Kocuria sp.]|nr:Rne/Rng family ribonuclease [Kocuria sp.]